MYIIEQGRRYAKLVKKVTFTIKDIGLKETLKKIKSRLILDWNYENKRKTLLGLDSKRLKQEREQASSYKTSFSILVPLFNTPPQYLKEMLESVIQQTYSNWQLCLADASDKEHAYVGAICRRYATSDSRIIYKKISNMSIAQNTNVCLSMGTKDFVGLLDHDDILHPSALYKVAQEIDKTGADFLYTDETKFENDIEKSFAPNFKPCFSKDEIRSHNYICHFMCFRRALTEKIGGYRKECDGSQDHDMVLRLSEQTQKIAHIPQILYFWRVHSGSVASNIGVKLYAVDAAKRAITDHLRRCGEPGKVESAWPFQAMYRIKYQIKGTPLISVVIDDINDFSQLKETARSIVLNTAYSNFEIVMRLEDSLKDELIASMQDLQPQPLFIFITPQTTKNEIMSLTTAPYVAFLGNTTPLTHEWIEELLMFCQRKDVAAVGAKILTENGTIYCADITLNTDSLVEHLYQGTSKENHGYEGRLRCARNVLALSDACMMFSRTVYKTLGGFDENTGPLWNIDFCLQAHNRKFLNTWTPHAELICHKPTQPPTSEELVYFKAKWRTALLTGDPFCPSNLREATIHSY